MKTIYLDNYKGFKKQIINLNHVNFLVGGNSTGKTSFLKIINLVSSFEFWVNFEFNNSEIDLGYFDEIINKNSTSKSFHIGTEKLNVRNKSTLRLLLTFKEKKFVPSVSRIKFGTDEYDILLKINKNGSTFSYKKKNDVNFKEWANDFKFSRKFKKVENLIPYNVPLWVVADRILDEIDKRKNNTKYRINLLNHGALYSNCKWIAPMRAEPKRLYESYDIEFSPKGLHMPFVLKTIIDETKTSKSKMVLKALNKFGKSSSLFEKISINKLSNANNSPFEILIQQGSVISKLTNVGYGVSQSLPLVLDMLTLKRSCFLMQQPEVHLHPKAQSAFGELIYDSIDLGLANTFFIETHSDYMIDEFRHNIFSNKKDDFVNNSQILFFTKDEGLNKVEAIEIKDDGKFAQNLPIKYRNFFIKHEIKMFEF